MLTIKAPAKLNLTLEVLSKRPDGYHEMRSVLQTIALYDILSFQAARKVNIEADRPSWSAAESLVSKAVRLVQEAARRSAGVDIKIEKRIPMMAGLGGDSSDAAAALRGLNELWALNLSRGRLLEMAALLGSDVAFFLRGGTALAAGRGEKLTPLPSPVSMWSVLVVPEVPGAAGKTGRMYAALGPAHFTGGTMTDSFVKFLKKDKEISAARLFNTFENVAFDLVPELKVLKGHFTKLGAQDIHLAGSGPALFTLLEDKAQAEDLYTRCQQQGLETYLAETL
jgi:4-diphosphocytidyl-2-C-methyl-D-erythritol kinase